MVDDLVVAAELRKLVADLVEAVRAARDDRLHLVAVERLDRVLREHLIQILVAHAARRIAVALFFLAEDREVDVRSLEDARERDGDLLRAVVERSHAADPEQHVGALAALHHLGHRRDVHPLRPVRAIGGVERPRRAVALERLERRLDLLGKRDSVSTRLRRSSLMMSSWSIETGHSCTHARQLVHAQSSSSVM